MQQFMYLLLQFGIRLSRFPHWITICFLLRSILVLPPLTRALSHSLSIFCGRIPSTRLLFFSVFLAYSRSIAVSFSIVPDCIAISLIRLSFFSLSFFLSLCFSLPPCVRFARARKARNSVEYAQRRAFNTLCSALEGSVRYRRDSFLFSYDALPLSSSHTQQDILTDLFPIDNWHVLTRLRSIALCVRTGANPRRISGIYARFDSFQYFHQTHATSTCTCTKWNNVESCLSRIRLL